MKLSSCTTKEMHAGAAVFTISIAILFSSAKAQDIEVDGYLDLTQDSTNTVTVEGGIAFDRPLQWMGVGRWRDGNENHRTTTQRNRTSSIIVSDRGFVERAEGGIKDAVRMNVSARADAMSTGNSAMMKREAGVEFALGLLRSESISKTTYGFESSDSFFFSSSSANVRFRWEIDGKFSRELIGRGAFGTADVLVWADISKIGIGTEDIDIEGAPGASLRVVRTIREEYEPMQWSYGYSAPFDASASELVKPERVKKTLQSDWIPVMEGDSLEVSVGMLLKAQLTSGGWIDADFNDTLRLVGIDWADSNAIPTEPGTVTQLQSARLTDNGDIEIEREVLSTDGTISDPSSLPEMELPTESRLTESWGAVGRVNWTIDSVSLDQEAVAQLMANLSQDAVIDTAFLYATTYDKTGVHPAPTLTFADHTYEGTDWQLVARPPEGQLQTQAAFRADVTDVLMTALESDSALTFPVHGLDGSEGATLAVVYSHHDEPLRSIALIEGYPSNNASLNYDARLAPLEDNDDAKIKCELAVVATNGTGNIRINVNDRILTESLGSLYQTYDLSPENGEPLVRAGEESTRLNIKAEGEVFPFLIGVRVNDLTDISLKPKPVLTLDDKPRADATWVDSLRIGDAGEFEFDLTAEPGTEHAIEFSTDLINWETLGTIINETGDVTIVDPAAPDDHQRYYRLAVEARPNR